MALTCPKCRNNEFHYLQEPMDGDSKTLVCFYCDHKLHISDDHPCPYCSYTPDLWERLDEHTWHCPYCGSEMNDSEFRAWADSVEEARADQQDEENRQ